MPHAPSRVPRPDLRPPPAPGKPSRRLHEAAALNAERQSVRTGQTLLDHGILPIRHPVSRAVCAGSHGVQVVNGDDELPAGCMLLGALHRDEVRAGGDCAEHALVEAAGLLGAGAGKDHALRCVCRGRPSVGRVCLPQANGRAHGIDQCGDAALVPGVERCEHELGTRRGGGFGAGFDAIDGEVVGDVRWSARRIERRAEVAHAADLMAGSEDPGRLRPVHLRAPGPPPAGSTAMSDPGVTTSQR